MIKLLTIIPGGVASAILFILPLLRLLIHFTDKYIAASPDKHDDKGWARIKSTAWFAALNAFLQVTAGLGLELPKGKGK